MFVQEMLWRGKKKAASEIGQLITQHSEKPWFISLFWKVLRPKQGRRCYKGDWKVWTYNLVLCQGAKQCMEMWKREKKTKNWIFSSNASFLPIFNQLIQSNHLNDLKPNLVQETRKTRRWVREGTQIHIPALYYNNNAWLGSPNRLLSTIS